MQQRIGQSIKFNNNNIIFIMKQENATISYMIHIHKPQIHNKNKYSQDRYLQTHSDLILKENQAKKNLAELDDSLTKINKNLMHPKVIPTSIQNSLINGWQSDYDVIQDENKEKIQRQLKSRVLRSKILGESENSIFELKRLLIKLQSPKKKQLNRHQQINLLIQKKMKPTIKISEILKFQQNQTSNNHYYDSNHVNNYRQIRPLTSATERLNSINSQSRRIVSQQGGSKHYQKIKQIQMLKVLKKKRQQQIKRIKQSRMKLMILVNKQPQAKSKVKQKSKLTLINLLQ